MATTTAAAPHGTTPPTEAEIREAIEDKLLLSSDGSPAIDEPDAVYKALRAILDSEMALVRAGWNDFHPRADHPGTLWADMKPSEVTELQETIAAALGGAFRDYLVDVRERVVAATLAFADRHPDIPRGRWPIAQPEPAPGAVDPEILDMEADIEAADAPESIVAAAERVLLHR